ncbi:hypothetical protein [Yinghuangia sp. YIM S09857]|uniref:hypothetical protein n=1 Tax=Yinghuangia sp. YIM S09857 TaxID=3436929 RepID=UPI003F53A4E8
MTAIRYELARLRTVRATWGAAFGVLAIGAATTWVEARDLGTVPVEAGDAALVLTAGAVGSATPLAVLVVVFAAVLSCTREQRAAALPTLLLTLPRRSRVLAAKVAVSAVLGAFIGALGLFVNGVVAASVFGPEFRTLVWDQAPAPRVLLGYVVYLALAAVLGVAVGVLARGAAIAAGLLAAGPVLIEPMLGRVAGIALPERFQEWQAYLPFNAADRMLATGGGGLTAREAALVFGGWTAAALLLAAVVFARRDAR